MRISGKKQVKKINYAVIFCIEKATPTWYNQINE